jgi:plastocyanin
MEKQNKGISQVIVLLVGAALLLLVGYVYIQGKNKSTSMDMTITEPTPTSSTPEIATTPELSPTLSNDAETKVFKIEAGSYYFKPNEIRVKKGDKVRIELSIVDMMHNLVIDELNVKTPTTQAGKSTSVEFTASQAGEFEFYCGVANHRKMGQVGKLIVE